MIKLRVLTILLGVLILHLGIIGDRAKAENLHEAMDKASAQIVEVLKQEKKPALAIGTFTPSRVNPANGGPGLQRAIIQALEAKQAGIVQKQAAVVLTAKFRVVGEDLDEQGQFIREKVTFQLLDEEDEPVGGPIITFFNRLQDIARTEGLTGSLNLDDDTRAQHESLKKGIEKPSVSVHGSLVKSSPNGKYAVEIAAKSLADANKGDVAARPIPATVAGGLAEVSIGIGQVYEVRVHNQSDDEIAAQVDIDGIDMFTFSEDRDLETPSLPKFSHMIVSPHGAVAIPGWHKTIDPSRDDNFISFLVTKYGEGAASKLPTISQGKVGVITVSVSLSHQEGVGKARSSAETGFGPPVKRGQKAVQRRIDPAHEFISVRYAR